MNLFDKVEDRIDKKIRIGIIIKNDKDEILLAKNSIERINKDMYEIPFIEELKFDKDKIIKDFYIKYEMDIVNLREYINEYELLDDNCNKITQINMVADYRKKNITNKAKYSWNTINSILKNDNITLNIKSCINVYKYNFA